MKNKFTIIVFSILITTLLIYMFFFRCYRKLPEFTNYSIISSNGIVIPAKLYKRTVKSTIEGKEENIEELIICFNDTLLLAQQKGAGDEKLYKYLVIIPKLKVIGLINNMKALKEEDNYICQEDRGADTFTSMINNNTFFINPPIKDAIFTNNKIVFNTYGVLKKFGKSIIIETNKVSNVSD